MTETHATSGWLDIAVALAPGEVTRLIAVTQASVTVPPSPPRTSGGRAFPMGPDQIRFAADRMLGRLAKMLRLLGYDTLYSPEITPTQLGEIARQGGRVVLTRGFVEKRFPGIRNLVRVGSDYAPEQLREVVERCRLDTRTGLWTRCTLCNAPIHRIDKATVEGSVPCKVLQIYDEFFRCAGCRHVYWRGSHVERIIRNLGTVLAEGDTRRRESP